MQSSPLHPWERIRKPTYRSTATRLSCFLYPVLNGCHIGFTILLFYKRCRAGISLHGENDAEFEDQIGRGELEGHRGDEIGPLRKIDRASATAA